MTTKYKVILSDGTIIDDLELNGNNFISKTEITEEMFYGKCSPVTISDGIVEDVHQYMDLVQVMEVDGLYWFILRDMTENELDKLRLQADITYIAMMAGVDLY